MVCIDLVASPTLIQWTRYETPQNALKSLEPLWLIQTTPSVVVIAPPFAVDANTGKSLDICGTFE